MRPAPAVKPKGDPIASGWPAPRVAPVPKLAVLGLRIWLSGDEFRWTKEAAA